MRSFAIALALWIAAMPCGWGQISKGEVGDVPELKKRAAAGDAAAIAELGWYRVFSIGSFWYNEHHIVEEFQKAADKGEPLGQLGLAYCHAKIIGGLEDRTVGYELVEKAFAAKPEHPLALAIKARYHERGWAGEKDLDKAFELYSKSWAKQCPLGGYHLARCYQYGMGTEADLKKARAMAEELSLDYRFISSAQNLVVKLDDAVLGTADYALKKQLIAVLGDGARRRDPNALYAMAWLHRKADDWKMAMRYYEGALFAGNPQAMGNVANWMATSRTGAKYVRSEPRVMYRLARLAYERTTTKDHAVRMKAAMDYTEGHSGLPKRPDQTLPMLRALIFDGGCDAHDHLAYFHALKNPAWPKEFFDPELALAHAFAHAHHKAYSNYIIFEIYSGRRKGGEVDHVKAYAAGLDVLDRDKSQIPSKHIEAEKKKLDGAGIAEAKRLVEDGFPHEIKYRQQWIDLLVKKGYLPEPEEKK